MQGSFYRDFYFFAVFLNIIMALSALLEAVVYSQVGSNMYYLTVYPNLLLIYAFFVVLQAAVVLRYLRMKQYTVAFRVGIPYYVFVVLYILLNYSLMKLASGIFFFLPISILTLLLQVVYGLTVYITTSRDLAWFRIAGILAALLALVSLSLTLIVASGKFVEYHSAIESLHGPLLWGSALLPVMLALNFYRELQASPKNEENAQSPLAIVLAYPVVLVAALYLLVTFGSKAADMKKWLPDMDAAIKEVAKPFEPRTYVNAEGDSLNYRLLKPIDFDPSKSYPIVVCLHGSGGNGDDNYRQVANALLPEFLTQRSNREKYQAFVFVPQCPFGTSWGGIHPLPGIDEIVFEAMAAVEKEFPVDPDRRYVTGASLGGYGTWHFIESHPDVFAAAIPIAGVGDPKLASQCANVPVWAFHGEKDDRVPVSGSRDMIDALKAAGGNPRYSEFAGADHYIGKLVCDTPGLLEWLFAQRRGNSTSAAPSPQIQ